MKNYIHSTHARAKHIVRSVHSNRHVSRANAIGILWIAGLCVVLVLLITAIGIYQFGWQNRWTAAVSSAVSLPAATSSQATVSYRNYVTQAHSIEMYFKSNPKIKPPTGKAIAQQAMAQAQTEALVTTHAQQEGVTATDAEVAAKLEKVLGQYSDRKKFMRNLDSQYGLSPDDFKAYLRYKLLEEKLQKRLDKQGGYVVWLRQQQAAVKFNVLIPQAK